MRCALCKVPIERSNPEFPFCSPRCRTLDLGNWANESYVISSPVFDEDELENLDRDQPTSPKIDEDDD